MKQRTKKLEKGITLIALVITIIVLLILVGISIVTLTGENGVINKATEAKTASEISREKEEISLAYTSVKADKMIIGDYTPVAADALETELNKSVKNAQVEALTENGESKLKVTMPSGNVYIINNDGTIKSSGNPDDENNENPPVESSPLDIFSFELDETTRTAKVSLNEEYKYGEFQYDENTARESYYKIKYNEDFIEEIIIPSEYTENSITYTVTSVDDFRGLNITKVSLPETITTICYDAFGRCEFLEDINIPSSVTTIGSNAFSDCDSLSNVRIPNGVTNIGDSAFSRCDSLSNVQIPGSVTSIGDYAFKDCNLQNIQMENGENTMKIGQEAFAGNPFNNVSLPNNLTEIGEYAFDSCNSLTSITIPESVVTIGSRAFYNCSKLENIYCEVSSKPTGWNNYWNETSAEVHWKQ